MACVSYDLNISSFDTNQATGNTIFNDGVVYVDYTDCSGITGQTQLSAGIYPDQVCQNDVCRKQSIRAVIGFSTLPSS